MEGPLRRPTSADGVLGSPLRLLSGTLIYVVLVYLAAVIGYLIAGWSLGDAIYMVTLTVFSVGYGEVRPVDTLWLRILTTSTMILGCTGMIVLTGALVQVFSLFQLRSVLGFDRMQSQIDRLQNHVIICGFGRIGIQLAKELQDARSGFVIIERDPKKFAAAEALGHLCLNADATDEKALGLAGIGRARVLATVLPDDAANVFITLSARNLSRDVEIIARGEAPSTESKLFHAGADKVVLPTHIGAERIATMILYPATDKFVAESEPMRDIKRGLHEFGLELEVVSIAAGSAMVGESVGDAEQRGQGGFFIVEIDRGSGQTILHPGEDVRIEAGDRIVLVVRGSRVATGAIFARPRGKVRVRRSFY